MNYASPLSQYFKYLYFHLRFLTDLTLEVDMPSLKMFVKNMHNLMHLRMV